MIFQEVFSPTEIAKTVIKRQDVVIESPCNANWSAMQRGDKSRFCNACKKTVHDLAGMAQREAAVLVAKPATEDLCVRYLHDELGHVVSGPAAVAIAASGPTVTPAPLLAPKPR